jgi:hypothetical protein
MPFCRNCGTEFTEGAGFCSKCGEKLTPPVTTHNAATSAPRKDAGVAALIAALVGIFLLGFGHFYVGRIGRGLIFLVVGFIVKVGFILSIALSALSPNSGNMAYIPLALLNLVVWAFQIYDAYGLAKRYNAEVEQTGRPPW